VIEMSTKLGSCFQGRLLRSGHHVHLEMSITEILERAELLIPKSRIIVDKNFFQIIQDGRHNEFHRIKSFPMNSSKHRKIFSTVSLIGRDTVNFRTNSIKGSGMMIP